MTYNEWRDELKSNLLNVSENERKRVLDYYAEAYADRREAGYSEKHIINDFGAPYDAAQRILLNIYDNENDYESCESESLNVQSVREEKTNTNKNNNQGNQAELSNTIPKKQEQRSIFTILISILLAIVAMIAIVAVIGALAASFVAPLGCVIGSLASIVMGFMELGKNVYGGVYSIGEGIFVLGFGLIIIPLCITLIKIFIKWLKKLFNWSVSLLNGKEYIK